MTSAKIHLLDLYFKIILSSVLCGLVIWGSCSNTDLLQSLKLLPWRAARIIYNLPHETPTDEVYQHSNWNTVIFFYKFGLIKLFHSVFIGEAPAAYSYLTNKPCTSYNLRRSNNIMVPHFNLMFLKNSRSYRGAISWNAVSTHYMGQCTDFIVKWRRTSIVRNLILAHSWPSRCLGTTTTLNASECVTFYAWIALVNLFRYKYVNLFEYFSCLDTNWIFSCLFFIIIFFLPW